MNNSNFVEIYVKPDPANHSQVVVSVNDVLVELQDITPTGRQILNAAACHPVLNFALLQHLPDSGLEEIGPDEVVQLDATSTKFFAFLTDRLFYFVLNDKKFPWGMKITEATLRLLADVPHNAEIWMERKDAADLLLAPGSSVNLAGDGVERFYTKIPTWKLDVQGVVVESPGSNISVRHALELANINPDLPWTFVLKVQGKPKEQVSLTTIIDLTTPGIERLRVMPKVINNGEAPCPRRMFSLLDRDTKFLDEAGYRWETVIDGERRWLLVHDYRLPLGYLQSTICLAIEVPSLYPTAELDMFYCSPAVFLEDGRAIAQTEVQQSIVDTQFQRWSRHREGSVWSSSDDSIITHLGLVEESLVREVTK
jgi:hypothetical protein